MNIKLPMKFRMLQLICEYTIKYQKISSKKLVEIMRPEYEDEKQFNYKTISSHILALKAIGLIKEINCSKKDKDTLFDYKSTKEGFKKMNLIPNKSKCYKEWLSFKPKFSTFKNSVS